MKTRTNKRGAGGFTLVELLVVIAIIGILAGLIYGGVTHAVDRARRASTRTLVGAVDQAFQLFKADFGQLPTNAVPLSTGHIRNDPEFIRLWLLGMNENGEITETPPGDVDQVRNDTRWNGPYLDVKIGKQLIEHYKFTENGQFSWSENLDYVLVDSWGQRLYYELYDPDPTLPPTRQEPMFNVQKWDVWSRGPDGWGTHDRVGQPGNSMDEFLGDAHHTYESRRKQYKDYEETINGHQVRVNFDNIGNWQ